MADGAKPVADHTRYLTYAIVENRKDLVDAIVTAFHLNIDISVALALAKVVEIGNDLVLLTAAQQNELYDNGTLSIVYDKDLIFKYCISCMPREELIKLINGQ